MYRDRLRDMVSDHLTPFCHICGLDYRIFSHIYSCVLNIEANLPQRKYNPFFIPKAVILT